MQPYEHLREMHEIFPVHHNLLSCFGAVSCIRLGAMTALGLYLRMSVETSICNVCGKAMWEK